MLTAAPFNTQKGQGQEKRDCLLGSGWEMRVKVSRQEQGFQAAISMNGDSMC